MAHIIPERPVGSVSPEVVRVFNALKRLPDTWRAWFHIAPWEPEAPDFLLLGPEQQAIILKVSRATPEHARQAPQLQLLELEQEAVVPGEAEELCVRTFLRALARDGLDHRQIGAAIVFPNLTRRDIRLLEATGSEPHYSWLDRAWLNDQGADAWLTLFPDQPLDRRALDLVRAQFTPETVIPAAFTARAPAGARRRSKVTSTLADYLLDYEQEAIVKSHLSLAAPDEATAPEELSPGGAELARDFRIQLVNGVAGSGKTLILLYRLRLLQNLFPRKSYQVLTHNRPLLREMEARYSLLSAEGGKAIHWHTFMQWCRRHWPRGQAFNVLPDYRRSRILRSVWADELRDSSITERMFVSELGWLKDNGIAQLDAYYELSRRGRGFRLSQEQRERMFRAIQTYQLRLHKLEMMDWWDVPRRYWHWIEEGTVVPPRFDVVLVDEAQFFAPLWFNIVREIVLPEVGHLFLAADPTQGFLHRGESWRSIAGIEVRGRAHLLRRSYRTTRKILKLALTFYRQRLPEGNPDQLVPVLKGMRAGKAPLLLRFDAPQDERQRIISEIKSAIERGLPPKHLLILHASGKGVTALIEALDATLGAGSARDPKDVPPGDFVRVTTLNAGAGLESPIVFVAGLQELFEQEGGLTLTDEDRGEMIEEHTRKLYMAFTRAGQRLILSCVGDVPAAFDHLVAEGLLALG
jgi:hypothetical protein